MDRDEKKEKKLTKENKSLEKVVYDISVWNANSLTNPYSS